MKRSYSYSTRRLFVLCAVYSHGGSTRAEIASMANRKSFTGFNSVAGDLIREGLIEAVPAGRGRGGRETYRLYPTLSGIAYVQKYARDKVIPNNPYSRLVVHLNLGGTVKIDRRGFLTNADGNDLQRVGVWKDYLEELKDDI